MKYRLSTLGGVSLTRDGQPLDRSTVQRRRLALLTLVAAAGQRGISRDRLMSVLWPDSEPAKARQVLTQWLHLIRKDLGDAEILLGTADLRLNPELITSDVAELEEALDANGNERAAALYAGPFLDGFYLGGAPEFERWVDEQRTRFTSKMRGVFDALAKAAASKGDRAAAVVWTERFAALDPLDARAALAYMHALAAAGERERAIRHAAIHSELVRAQLETEPDPSIDRLARELRVAPATQPARAAATPPRAAAHHATQSMRWGAPRVGAIAVALLVLMATVTVAFRGRAGRVDANLVVVFPFRVVSNDPSLLFLREGMLDLLGATFTGEGGPRARDTRAVLADWRRIAGDSSDPTEEALRRAGRASGAATIVVGTIVGSRSQLIFNTRLVDTRTGDVRASVTQRGPADSIPVLVDRTAAGLLAGYAGVERQEVSAFARVPLPVLRAYLDGEAASRAGRYEDAIQHHEAALELDSTFVPAAFGLAFAAQWFRGSPVQQRATRLLLAQREHLSSTQRALLAPWASNYAQARLAAWQHITELFPENAQAWYEVGDLLLHDGPRLGEPDILPRVRRAFLRALALDSALTPAVEHMVDLEILLGHPAAARSWAERYYALSGRGENADYTSWRLAVAEGDEHTLARLRSRFDSTNTTNLRRIITFAQMDGVGLDDAQLAAETWVRQAATESERRDARMHLAQLLLNRGRITALNALRTDRLPNQIDLFGPLYFGDDTSHVRAWLAGYERSQAREPTDTTRLLNRYATTCFNTLYFAVAGDRPAAIENLRRLNTMVPNALRAGIAGLVPGKGALCPAVVATWMAVADSGAAARPALEHLDSWALQDPEERPIVALHLLLADMWERVGDPRRALAAVQRRAYHGGIGDQFLLPAVWKEARIADQLGERDVAIRAYRHFIALRSVADARLQGDVAFARRALARLAKK